jgi:ABC-type thiamin/hydroxymethylpyrimidine transport system permease subunit
MEKLKDILKITSIPVVFASLCCLSPVILVLLGLSTVSFASSLADTFYGLLALVGALVFYLRRQKGICTIDDVKRRRNEVINIIALSLIGAIVGYIFFLYVVLHYIGVFLNIWN